MFKEVTGILFAPESFKQHLVCESNVGILPLSVIKQCFPERDLGLIKEFLVYSEFCQRIDDSETLNLIQGTTVQMANDVNQIHSLHDSSSPEEYLFFPGLVNSDQPDNVWNCPGSSCYSYACGWCLQCTSNRGFPSRYMHVLFLRLTFTFAAAVPKQSSTVQTALKRRCDVWKNGIHWSTTEGVEILVEFLEEMSIVLVLIRCLKGQELEAVHTRSSVLKKVWETKHDISPQLTVDEYLIHSPDLSTKYPTIDDKGKVSITDIAWSVTHNKPCVSDSSNKPICLDDLLYFEPFCRISMEHISALFSNERANEDVSSDTLLDISKSLHPVCEQLIQVLDLHPIEVDIIRQDHGSNPVIFLHHIFDQLWKQREMPASFQKLCSKLNEFSIFFGRNPLSLVGLCYVILYKLHRFDLMSTLSFLTIHITGTS